MNFDAADIEVTVELSLEDALFPEDGADTLIREVTYSKKVLCQRCQGSREASGSKPSQCYSCKGNGIRKDPLFGNE